MIKYKVHKIITTNKFMEVWKVAKYGNDPNYKYEITEILGIASPQETLTSNWAKAVLKSLMTTSEGQEEGLDIRRYDTAGQKCAKGAGIRLTIEEAHNVCNILLQNGYGSLEVLESEYNKRKRMFE